MAFYAKELLSRFGELIASRGGHITGSDIEAVISKYSEDVETKLVEADEKESEILDEVKDKLEAIIMETEKAVDSIMDSVEKIQQKLESVENEDASNAICDSTMEILESCNFQDINGQKIQKIKVILHNIAGNSRSSKEVIIDARMDADLMNGPSDGAAPSQDDVDKLFGDA